MNIRRSALTWAPVIFAEAFRVPATFACQPHRTALPQTVLTQRMGLQRTVEAPSQQEGTQCQQRRGHRGENPQLRKDVGQPAVVALDRGVGVIGPVMRGGTGKGLQSFQRRTPEALWNLPGRPAPGPVPPRRLKLRCRCPGLSRSPARPPLRTAAKSTRIRPARSGFPQPTPNSRGRAEHDVRALDNCDTKAPQRLPGDGYS